MQTKTLNKHTLKNGATIQQDIEQMFVHVLFGPESTLIVYLSYFPDLAENKVMSATAAVMLLQ